MRRVLAFAATLALAAGLMPQAAHAVDPIAFEPGVRLLCPAAPSTTPLCDRSAGRNEPSIVVDQQTGVEWVSDQTGIPGGSQLWRRAPGEANFTFVAKIDEIPVVSERRGLAAGGGDNDVTLSTDGTVYATSLWAGGVTFAAFAPDGTALHRNYLAGGKASIDRQWTAAHGADTAYEYTRDFAAPENLWVSRTDTKGLVWSPPVSVLEHGIGSYETTGNIITDPEGTVFAVYSDTGGLWIARCRWTTGGCADAGFPGGVNPTFENMLVQPATTEPGTPGTEFGTKFEAVAADREGNLYLVWSDMHAVWFTRSTDHGDTWAAPIFINDLSVSTSSVFPWIVAGSEGRVGVAWLGSKRATPDTEGTANPWYAYYAQSIDALADEPTFQMVQASDDPVHNADICLNGLGCDIATPAPVEIIEPVEELFEQDANNRKLAEVVQLAIEPHGYAVVAFPDDYERNAGTTTRSVVARQIAGEPLYAP